MPFQLCLIPSLVLKLNELSTWVTKLLSFWMFKPSNFKEMHYVDQSGYQVYLTVLEWQFLVNIVQWVSCGTCTRSQWENLTPEIISNYRNSSVIQNTPQTLPSTPSHFHHLYLKYNLLLQFLIKSLASNAVSSAALLIIKSSSKIINIKGTIITFWV